MNRALAIQKLTQLSICDICYLNEYSCEFATYYYQCGMTQYVDLYFHKLPEPFGALWYREFRESFPDNTNLGPQIEFAKQKINQECTQARLYRKAKKAQHLCCGKANPVGQWGCSTKSYKKPKNTKLIIKKVSKDNRKRGKRYYRKARSAETCKCFFCNKEGRHVLKSLKSLKGNFYRLIEKVYIV